MRIGMMVDMYKPYISGVTNYVALNKRWLEAQGHKVFVFTFGDEAYEDDELYVVRSPGLPMSMMDLNLHVSFRYSAPAQKKLQSMDVVHVHHPFLSGPLALRYCRPHTIPVVYTNHTRLDLYAHHYLPSMLPDAVGETFLRAYMPNFCAQCDLVIAPSAGLAEVLRGLGVESPISVIPNGIDFAPFANVPPLTRAEAGLPDDALVLMYVGRLSQEKNLTFLLRAFFGVAAAAPRVVLALVGGGPELENLKDQAEHSGFGERVRFIGRVEFERVPSYLRLGDVFVTASITEVHPFSLIEAMASGLPALGITSPGIADTIVDGENGLLSAGDIAAFTAKLMRLVMEPEMRARMGAAAREHARRYDIQRTGRRVFEEYQRLAAERRQRLNRWDKFKANMRRWFATEPQSEGEP
jgi:glycosyltransferase involved in cell wall biosynthesis